MKKVFLMIAVISLTLTSCSDGKKQTDPVLNDNWKKEIKLDNGAKWEANLETTVGVSDMLKLIKEHNDTSLEGYLALGKKLNERKNTLVKECTMEGPSHDNLHIFLYPLIEKIDLLLKAASEKEAKDIVSSITDNLKAYNTYFK